MLKECAKRKKKSINTFTSLITFGYAPDLQLSNFLTQKMEKEIFATKMVSAFISSNSPFAQYWERARRSWKRRNWGLEWRGVGGDGIRTLDSGTSQVSFC